MEAKNPWKRATFILLFCIVIVMFFGSYLGIGDSVFGNKPEGYDSLEEAMCRNIKGTPAWADSSGVILDYGYKEFNMSIVQALVEDKIYFLYHPDCVHCQRQIDHFGDDWSYYKESGYTVDCSGYF